MTTLSRKTFIAIEAVVYIACHSGSKPVRSREICEYQDVTLRYLEHILQALVKAGVLKGLRGPKGGYVLARERRKIPLSDIHDAVRLLANGEETPTSSLYKKILKPLEEELQEVLHERLASLTIEQLCERAGQGKTSGKSDFAI